MFFVVLLVLLLMAISYYIGYHHLFYGNQPKVVKQPVVVHPVPLKKDTVQISKEQDSLKVDSGSIRSAGGYTGKNKQGESATGGYTKSICRIPAGEKRGIRNSRYTRRTSYEERGDFARFGIEILRLERFYSLPGGV